MNGNPEKITKGTDHVGQTCVVCGEVIRSEDEVVACPRCHSTHHANCWRTKGGCGKTGCPQLAQTVKGERPKGDGPPPPVSKKVIVGGVLGALAVILLLIVWPKPPDPAQGRVKIVVFGEAYYDLTESMTELANDFNATHEEIYIDLQLLPPGTMDTKLIVLIAANEAPDVLAIDAERFEQFKEQEVILPLGEDESGSPIYSIQHPAQLSQLVVWHTTEYPAQALEVLHYFADHIPPADLDRLRELEKETPPFGAMW